MRFGSLKRDVFKSTVCWFFFTENAVILKTMLKLGFLVFALSHFCLADIYLHFIPGSNNRLNGNQANVRNANRLYDSQVRRVHKPPWPVGGRNARLSRFPLRSIRDIADITVSKRCCCNEWNKGIYRFKNQRASGTSISILGDFIVSFSIKGLTGDPTTRWQRERQRNNRIRRQFARASHFFIHFFALFARLWREIACLHML